MSEESLRRLAVINAEFDQKKMVAREMIMTHFQGDDSERLREIINYFVADERLVISMMGILSQVGLMALVAGEPDEDID